MTVYRYKLTSLDASALKAAVALPVTVNAPAPISFIDLTVSSPTATDKEDLDAAMLLQGFTFYSTDPTMSVTQEAAFSNPMLQGPQGPAGADGSDGEQGPTGTPGVATGAQGPQGVPGPPGEDGADGADGRQGIDGVPGATGAQGIPGADGADGADGNPGPQGQTGAQGPQGDQGPQGLQGIPGVDGEDGSDGPPGPQGPTGAQGPQGDQGPQGLQGIPGNDGADGESGAQGPTGATGATGAQGPQGLQGIPGNDGADGEQGTQGPAGSPADGDKAVQFNNGGAFGGSQNLVWDNANAELGLNGDILFSPIALPAVPAATKLKIYSRQLATRPMLQATQPGGEDYGLQPGLFSQAVAMWLTQTGTTLGLFGMGSTNAGTLSHPALANTNFLTAMRRVRFASSGTAGSFAGARGVETMVWRGNAAGLGGFFFACRFAMTTNLANARAFIGLNGNTAALANADPSGLATDICGISLNSADANWTMICNDNAGACTTTDLGASFVKSTTAVYELRMYAAPNGSDIFWQVDRLDTGATSSGTFLNTNIPRNTVFLNPYIWITNNATASAAQIEMSRMYLESDF